MYHNYAPNIANKYLFSIKKVVLKKYPLLTYNSNLTACPNLTSHPSSIFRCSTWEPSPGVHGPGPSTSPPPTPSVPLTTSPEFHRRPLCKGLSADQAASKDPPATSVSNEPPPTHIHTVHGGSCHHRLRKGESLREKGNGQACETFQRQRGVRADDRPLEGLMRKDCLKVSSFSSSLVSRGMKTGAS